MHAIKATVTGSRHRGPLNSSNPKVNPDLHRAKDAFETNSNETHPDWALIAIVIFVVLVWSALFFCMYCIWAKCRGAPTF